MAKKSPSDGINIYDPGFYLLTGKNQSRFWITLFAAAIRIEWDRMGG